MKDLSIDALDNTTPAGLRQNILNAHREARMLTAFSPGIILPP